MSQKGKVGKTAVEILRGIASAREAQLYFRKQVSYKKPGQKTGVETRRKGKQNTVLETNSYRKGV